MYSGWGFCIECFYTCRTCTGPLASLAGHHPGFHCPRYKLTQVLSPLIMKVTLMLTWCQHRHCWFPRNKVKPLYPAGPPCTGHCDIWPHKNFLFLVSCRCSLSSQTISYFSGGWEMVWLDRLLWVLVKGACDLCKLCIQRATTVLTLSAASGIFGDTWIT